MNLGVQSYNVKLRIAVKLHIVVTQGYRYSNGKFKEDQNLLRSNFQMRRLVVVCLTTVASPWVLATFKLKRRIGLIGIGVADPTKSY
uniref:Uncharacterized protein n=6 Tax=Oryza TaxID=4527 RepID=A0A0E0E456_9ORYZ